MNKAETTALAKEDKSFTATLVEMGGGNIARLLQKRFDVEYFIGQAVLSIMGETKEKEYAVAKKHPHELLKVVGQQAILGLQSSLGLCHIVAFGQQLVLMVDFKGYLEVGHRHPLIKQIIARAVYERDEIDIDSTRKPPVTHKLCLDNDRGKLRGAYATVEFVNGTFDYRWCPESEILDIRNKYSKDWKAKGNNSAWGKRPSEFYIKTVVNLLWKMLPKTDEMHQLYKFDNEASAQVRDIDHEVIDTKRAGTAESRMDAKLDELEPAEVAEVPVPEAPFQDAQENAQATEAPERKDGAKKQSAAPERQFSKAHHQKLADLLERYGNSAVVDARITLGIMRIHISDHTVKDVERLTELLEKGTTE